MKKAVRAIIVDNGNLLVMERNKFGSHYFTLIGGHVEIGETNEEALLREISEETMVKVKNPTLVYIEHVDEPYGEQYIYLCDYISGVPMLRKDADERQISKGGINLYNPMWIPLQNLNKVTFRSEKLKKRLLKHLKDGFPKKIIEFSSVVK